MSSTTVLRDKNIFDNSVNNATSNIMKYKSDINTINNEINGNNNGRFLYDYISTMNGNILKKMDLILTNMGSIKKKVDFLANNRINELKLQEAMALKKKRNNNRIKDMEQ